MGVGDHRRGVPPCEEEVVRGEECAGAEERGVDLGEGLVKALTKREERNRLRRERIVTLARKEWARPAVKSEAVRGAGRCGKMVVQVQPHSAARPDEDMNPRPNPKVQTQNPTNRCPSQALENLHNVTDATEREDQAQHELKDIVDSKLEAWKETNIQALLGSLDVVLWPDLGLKKEGMGDLVSEKQVKV
jgi:hypothetical protein